MRIQELASSRELLWNLTLRELRGKYRRSVLGWAWSLLNPLATTLMYTFVFGVVFKAKPPVGEPSGLQVYALFLLTGLLPWNYFVMGTTQAMANVIANGGLVKKVWFPREVLVTSSVLAQGVSFLIEIGLLCVVLLFAGNMVLPWIPVVLVLAVLLTLATIGLSLTLAACNVYFRDLTYLWGIISQLWFFATPIIYAPSVLPSSLQWLVRLNPMYAFVSAFRDVLYDLRFPTALTWAKMGVTVAIFLGIGTWVFTSLSPRFAEEALVADAAISLERVSKRFRLYHDRNQTLKAAVVRGRRARYEEFWALREVSLEIDRGETFGIIGPNGSGKSTLLKCLAKILRPDEGTIHVRGSMSSLLELGAGFHPELSGRENVYLNAAILGLAHREVDARFDDIVSFAGLERFIDMPVKNYSSGMYVRLGFAVAINVDPEILLIDEVLAVGDEVFQRKSAEKIAEFRDSDRTVVLVSHSLAQVRSLCDRAVWIEGGEVLAFGPAPEVVDAYTGETHEDRDTSVSGSTRWGSGEVRITSVEMLDGELHAAGRITSGDRTIVRIRFNASTPVQDPVFGIAIEHIDGHLVAGTNTLRHGQTVQYLHGPGEVDVTIPSLPLAEGTYDLSVAIGDRTERNDYDYWWRPIRFDVRHADALTAGYVDLRCEFDLERAVCKEPPALGQTDGLR